MGQREWDPLKELSKVQERMNRLFESAMARTNFDAGGGVGAWTPTAEVQDGEAHFLIRLEVPGVRQEEMELRVEGDELVVEGDRRMGRGKGGGEQFHRVERSYGPFSRRFRLPSTVDRDSVAASYKDGVLEVTLRKRGPSHPDPLHVTIR